MPKNLREKVVWEEMTQAKVGSIARLVFPTGVPRQEVLKKVGKELGLRLFDDSKIQGLYDKRLSQPKGAKESGGDGRFRVDGPWWKDLREDIGPTKQVYLADGGKNHELGGHISVG